MIKLPDAYSFQARVIPVVVVILPPLFLLGASIISNVRVGIATSLVIAVLAALAGQLGRDRGKRLEPALWNEWGGAPTLQLLRYRGAADRGVTDRLHQRIDEILGDQLPTEPEEESDRAGSDTRYWEATRRLITLTLDHDRFPLVFAENISYGMRRNLLGLRPIGITVSIITIIAAALLLALASGHFDTRATRYGPGLAIAVIETGFWLVIVTKKWVKVPAEAYALRLMESVELLRRSASSAADGE